MGNKITRHREFIEERYTRPQGSYDYKDGDFRKLRRLILSGQLAPCYPGAEEYAPELDECPICFMFFPSVNRSRCCSKSVCTECYLQIKSTGYAPFTNCPFCKTSNYMVEYRGAKTAEEKDFEQAEEQKVIEAKIRIHQKELHDAEERLLRRGDDPRPEELDLVSATEHEIRNHDYDIQHIDQFHESFEHDEIQHGLEEDCRQQESSHHSSGDDESGLDMEDIMLMKAIWLSIQDQGQRSEESALSQQTLNSNAMDEYGLRNEYGLRRRKRGSLGHGGFTEMRGDRAASGSQSLLEDTNLTHLTSAKSGAFHTRSSTIEIPQRCLGADRTLVEDEEAAWGNYYIRKFYSQTQRGSSEEVNGLSTATTPMIPESFDEQVILAMALSLADDEVRAR